MKKAVLITLMLIGIVGPASAQHDDLYFVPKKRSKTVSSSPSQMEENAKNVENTVNEKDEATSGLSINEDAYNRRWSYLTNDGNSITELAQGDEGFVLITEEGDTMWMNTDTLHLTRVANNEGWVNGFDGSDSDYEYAMRIIRFRNPRYAIPVSSPLYWDVIHGNALWPSWDWNIYDDGMYAYVFPTSSNWHYWDYMTSYPFGWSPWGNSWNHFGWNYNWGWHYGWNYYGWDWFCSPWHDPFHYSCHHGYYPNWHYGHYPITGIGKPGLSGPKAFPNDRKATIAPTRSGTQDGHITNRGSAASTSATRSGTTVTRTGNTTTRSSSVRVVTGRTSPTERSSSSVRSSSGSRSSNDEMIHRNTSSSTISRGGSTGSSSRDSYTRQSSSRSSSGSSYNRPSSTRSSSSSTSSRSSSSYSSSRSSGNSSYSSGSSSSYSSGSSSYSSGSSRSSSYSSGSSYSGGSSRSSGSSYSGGSSRSSGSRR